ncbi:hypothetical protein J2741_002053 [Methanolinea mesophila]|uniref:hypothetical protein n=1 Tax=Methanolinea mesophila TaxID=547055 RepID=UPI001AE53F9D|nr:hypothetical protein [Methanolinea mesophila]MBP1929506.1 hypothetical protein [Methanolinea mesophila]
MEDLRETRSTSGDLPVPAVILCVLLAGSLSMLFAEVLSGASVLWFVTAWGWLVTFPLYMVHLVFLFSLAMMFRRTSFTSLYLWGVIFGMYESWITKVTWAGYIGSEPGWGTVLGFAPAEFMVIVLFWHPVMSFLFPLLAFEVLSSSSREDSPLLPGHRWLLAKGRRSFGLFAGVALIGAAFLSMNSGFNGAAALTTLLISAGIVAILYMAVSGVTGGFFPVSSLSLKKYGLFLALLYLAVLYLLAFFFLLPGRIPPAPTIVLTVLIYLVVVLLIWLDRPVSVFAGIPGTTTILGVRHMAGFLALASALIVLFSLVPALGGALGTGIYLILVFLGPLLALTVAGLVIFRFFAGRHAGRSPEARGGHP